MFRIQPLALTVEDETNPTVENYYECTASSSLGTGIMENATKRVLFSSFSVRKNVNKGRFPPDNYKAGNRGLPSDYQQ